MAELNEGGGVQRNLLYATAAQALSFAVSACSMLIVPHALGVEGYGYWQLFFLYSGYAGLALLGMNDGLVLRLAGKALFEVDRAAYKGEFCVAMALQLALLAPVAFLLIVLQGAGERMLVFICVFLYCLVANAYVFLSSLLQAVNLTYVQSRGYMLSRTLYLAFLAVLIACGAMGYLRLIVLFLVAQVLALLYLCLCVRTALRGVRPDVRAGARDALADVRSGLKVMLAYQADQLTMGFTRMMVDARWGIAVFGMFSLASSLVSFFLTFVSQVSAVLLPAIKRIEGEGAHQVMGMLEDALSALLPMGYLLYFPVCAFVCWWLPQYAAGMGFLELLLPICFFDSKMNILCVTYFKAFRREGILLAIDLAAMALSMLSAGWAVFLMDDVTAAVLGMVCCIALRSVASEVMLARMCGRRVGRRLAADIALACCFLVFTQVVFAPGAVLASVAAYYVATRESLASFLSLLRRRGIP